MRKVYNFNDKAKIVPFAEAWLRWPCRFYRVTFPQIHKHDDQDFNPFERCILKLIDCGCPIDPAWLANETGLPKDLIKLIIDRLLEAHAIDGSTRRVTSSALTKLSDRDRDFASRPRETWAIFRESVTNQLLPMLVPTDALRAEEFDPDGNAKSPCAQKARAIKIGSLMKKGNDSPPTADDVIAILKTMACRRHQIFNPIGKFETYISVSKDCEDCDLLCDLLAIRGQLDVWHILNPFESGFMWSPELETAYAYLLDQSDAERQLFTKWLNRGNNDNRPAQKPAEGQYAELRTQLNNNKPDIYASIEWALYYCLFEDFQQATLKILEEAKDTDNFFAKNIDAARLFIEPLTPFSPPPGFDVFFKRKNKKKMIQREPKELLNDFNGRQLTPNMNYLIPLAVIVASKTPGFTGIPLLLKQYPDFFEKVAFLRDQRNDTDHGTARPSTTSYKEADYQFLQCVVAALLPEFKQPVRSPDTSSPLGTIAARHEERRLAAIGELYRFFSNHYLFDVIAVPGLENLILAEMNYQSLDEEKRLDAAPGMTALYAALQGEIQQYLSLIPKYKGSLSEDQVNEAALERIKEIHWGDELPKALYTKTDKFRRHALLGYHRTTLGQVILAWILRAPMAALEHIRLGLPKLEDLCEIVNKRGHANSSLALTKNEFKHHRDTAYKFINIICQLTEMEA